MKHKAHVAIAVALVVVGFFLVVTTKPSGSPGFQIISPAQNEIFQGDVTLSLSLTDFQIVAPPENSVLDNVPGQGHFHVYLDGAEASYTQINSSVSVLKGISPGSHTMRVSMRQNNHYPLGIDRNVTFAVE